MATEPRAVDWDRLLRLARFHRVQGLVWQALAKSAPNIPEQVAAELAGDAASIAKANLEAAVVARDLVRSFEQAQIPCLTVKGLTLAALAYRTIATKSCVDLDLLIAEPDLLRAARQLSLREYALTEPRIDPADPRLSRWHRLRKESTWISRKKGVQVDLHTRLSDNAALIPEIGIGSPRQEVEIVRGVSLPTLAADELFAYLCVHGASSLWFRLKWITDFAALLATKDGLGIDRLYRRSQELGAARAAAQALLLADRIYDSLAASPDLRNELSSDRANRWLVHQAWRQLTGNTKSVEPTSRRFGTWRIHVSQLAMLPGAKFKIDEFVRQLSAALG